MSYFPRLPVLVLVLVLLVLLVLLPLAGPITVLTLCVLCAGCGLHIAGGARRPDVADRADGRVPGRRRGDVRGRHAPGGRHVPQGCAGEGGLRPTRRTEDLPKQKAAGQRV